MRLLLALVLLVAPTFAAAEPIVVGGRVIQIPVPEGYAVVTRDMKAVWDLAEVAGGATNEVKLTLIAEEGVREALTGEMTGMVRYFMVQSMKALERQELSASDFQEVMSLTRARISQSLMEQVLDEAPEYFDKMSEIEARRTGTNPGIGISGVKMMPLHRQTDRSMAFSMLMGTSFLDEFGTKHNAVIPATNTIALINGRLLFFYAYGDADDLDWTREVSDEWIHEILDANPD